MHKSATITAAEAVSLAKAAAPILMHRVCDDLDEDHYWRMRRNIDVLREAQRVTGVNVIQPKRLDSLEAMISEARQGYDQLEIERKREL